MNTKNLKQFLLCLVVALLNGGAGHPSVFNEAGLNTPAVPPVWMDGASSARSGTTPLETAGPAPSTRNERLLLAQSQGSKSSGNPNLAEITRVAAKEEADGSSIVTIESTKSLQYTAFRLSNPLRLVLDFAKTKQGNLVEQRDINTGIIKSISPTFFAEAEILRLEIGLEERVPYEVLRPQENQLVVKLQEHASDKMAKAKEKPEQVGLGKLLSSRKMPIGQEDDSEYDPCRKLLVGEKEKISFDFQSAKLKNLLRIISEVSGFNIVLSPEVKGSVNLRLENVPWNTALDIVLVNNGLGRECFNDIIRIATQKKLAQEARERLAAEKAKAEEEIAGEEAEDLITEVRRINYADIQELTKSLESLRAAWAVGKSDRGRITTDERTNTVILTDIRTHVHEMIELINTLDIQMPQVMIESRIVEVTRNVAKDLGIQWGGSVSKVTDKEFPNTIEGGSGDLTEKGFIVDLPAAAVVPTGGASLGLTLGSLAKDVILDIQLSALETQGKGRILSTPKVTTSDNKEAKILSGRKIPYATVSSDGTQIEFVDAVLSLVVTPHITSDNFIHMKIQAKKDAADFSNQVLGTPTITIKEATTQVLVKDGDTAVLGGLYESEVSKSRSQVPWFGDIPFLGNLFKSKTDSEDIDELLIFITPTVIKDTRVSGL